LTRASVALLGTRPVFSFRGNVRLGRIALNSGEGYATAPFTQTAGFSDCKWLICCSRICPLGPSFVLLARKPSFSIQSVDNCPPRAADGGDRCSRQDWSTRFRLRPTNRLGAWTRPEKGSVSQSPTRVDARSVCRRRNRKELCRKLGDDDGLKAAYRGGCPACQNLSERAIRLWKRLPTSSAFVSPMTSTTP